MPGTRRLRFRLLAVGWAWLAPGSTIALGGEAPPTAAIPRPEVDALARVPMLPRVRPSSTSADPGFGWWLGPAGVAAALAVCGGVSVASRRFLPTGDSGPIRVIGRSALSPKHSACLLRVGDRVLIVGFGPQGAPSTLGEVTDPAELARLAPRRPSPTSQAVPARPSTGFDRRIGDDE
jgi:flagellar protein FliO/FliZ